MVDWHEIWQNVMDDHLSVISGKVLEGGDREVSHNLRLDYYVKVQRSKPSGRNAPLSYLKRFNVIEFKGYNESLSRPLFRYYVGRTLTVEGLGRKPNRTGRVTLTVMVARLPRTVLNHPTFRFTRVSPYLYRSDWIENLEIYVLVLSQTRGIEGHEGLAFLQVLEGNPRYRRETWSMLVQQNIPQVSALHRIMMRIDKEVGMSLAEMWMKEGENASKDKWMKEGEKAGVKAGERAGERKAKREAIRDMMLILPTSLQERFNRALASAESIKELNHLQTQVLASLKQRVS